jgi:hypothetical protein
MVALHALLDTISRSFIAQLTLARYRGDTIFGFLSRMFSTFFGGLVGLAFWCDI